MIGVVDVGETPDGLRYMVMDFAAGPDLAALLGEAPMPAPPGSRTSCASCSRGSTTLTSRGSSIATSSPENVIVERDAHGVEVPRIVDFGIAILRDGGESADSPGRLTTNGLVLGTPHYMAPEQAVADPIDHRIDLFALGIIVYEMLSGKLPFDGTGAEVARANLLLDPPMISDRIPYLEVDPLLEAFARRLMAKKRDTRPPTAKAARDLLDLIDRDRAAAAAALGVPPANAARTPKTTAPAAMRQVSNDHPGTFPPPFRDAQTPPQAPPFGAPIAVAIAPRTHEQLISTDLSVPLGSPAARDAEATRSRDRRDRGRRRGDRRRRRARRRWRDVEGRAESRCRRSVARAATIRTDRTPRGDARSNSEGAPAPWVLVGVAEVRARSTPTPARRRCQHPTPPTTTKPATKPK